MASNKLAGQVALITGAGGGFGESFAKRFVAEGAKVVIAEINPTAGKRVEQEISSAHGDNSVVFVQTDVTSRASWEGTLQTALQRFGKLDIIINNAGTTHPKKPSHEITEDEWSRITEGLASEYGPDGIRVNSICPLLGYTGLTEIFTGVKDTPEFRAKFAATIPLKRGLEHEDLANAAVFLCSNDSSFITGVNIAVDGGSTCVVD
ncbi:hypothetical protein F5884DRAFT_678742 [Xylogone sp. PMI_703]|nr:hypothetical protein F5884DRAFT_678742 [Xylogone sp. PMI_703]